MIIIKDEIWKDITGYEGLYKISNYGNVKSLNYKNTNKEKILKPGNNGIGYLFVGLYKNNKRKYMFVHRLVAQEFIPNPNNFPEINHKDENKTNNNIDNLEWCNRKYNSNYGTRKERTKKNNINYKGENTYWYGKHHSEETKKKMRENHVNYSGFNNPNSKKIYCIELNKTWDCIKDCAEELKLHHQSISKVCKGKLKTTGGYHFEYLKEKN